MPASSFWKNWDQEAHYKCLNMAAVVWANGVLNTMTDLIVLVTPLGELLRLRLPLKRKLHLTSIFGVGLLYVATILYTLSFRQALLTDPPVSLLLAPHD